MLSFYFELSLCLESRIADAQIDILWNKDSLAGLLLFCADICCGLHVQLPCLQMKTKTIMSESPIRICDSDKLNSFIKWYKGLMRVYSQNTTEDLYYKPDYD